MKVIKKIITALHTAIIKREEPQIGHLDFKTGKVSW